jgi:hypothetical protein
MASLLLAFGLLLLLLKRVDPASPAVMGTLNLATRLFVHRWYRCLVGITCIIGAIGVLVWTISQAD